MGTLDFWQETNKQKTQNTDIPVYSVSTQELAFTHKDEFLFS